MSIQFSPVIAAQKRGGDAFAVKVFDLDELRGAASPVTVLDDFRVRGQPFPPHPHAGFSAVTYVFEDSHGALRSRDSLGNDVVGGPGGVVWTLAGSGVIHHEVPAQDDRELHGLQLFVNLSAENKLATPRMLTLAKGDAPEWQNEAGDCVRVVVGSYGGVASPLALVEPFDLLERQASAGDRLLAGQAAARLDLRRRWRGARSRYGSDGDRPGWLPRGPRRGRPRDARGCSVLTRHRSFWRGAQRAGRHERSLHHERPIADRRRGCALPGRPNGALGAAFGALTRPPVGGGEASLIKGGRVMLQDVESAFEGELTTLERPRNVVTNAPASIEEQGLRAETGAKDEALAPASVVDFAPTTDDNASDGEAAEAAPKSGSRRKLMLGVALLAFAAAASGGYLYWDHARRFESTDDAFIAARQFAVAPKVAGYVNAVLVSDNEHVAAGDVIARIDDRDYRVALDQAEAQVANAEAAIQNIDGMIAVQDALSSANQAQVEQAQAALAFAKQQADRYQELARDGAGSVQNAQQYLSQMQQQEAAVASAQAMFKQPRASDRGAESAARRRGREPRPGQGATGTGRAQSRLCDN